MRLKIHIEIEKRIFNIWERTNTKATFFCLGWIAEIYPQLIRKSKRAVI